MWANRLAASPSAPGVARCASDRRRCSAGVLAFAVLVGIVQRPGLANAQAAAAAERAAQLFDAGVADLKLKKYEAACGALEQSYGLDANLGTLIALGDCLERWGKLRSAAARFEELVAVVSSANASASAFRAPQLEYARSALARLAPEIPRLELRLPRPIEADVRILLDGRALETLPAQDVDVDPGPHVIETQAPGRQPWRLELAVSAGERRRVELALGRMPQPEPLRQPITADATPAPPLEPVRSTAPLIEASEPNPWRTLGWGLGGLGVAGIGVGAVAGVMVLQRCPGLECEGSRGKHLALVADVGFGVGLAALAASAIVLLNTEPTQRSDTARWRPLGSLDAHGGWLGVGHSF